MSRKKNAESPDDPNAIPGEKAPPLSKRERWIKYNVKRTKAARKALRNVARMANTASYDSSPEERKPILEALEKDMAELRRLFTGAPREKGLYDI